MNAESSAATAPVAAHRAFTSFSNRDFRIYLCSATAAMSGLSVGLLGASVGINDSLAFSAVGLLVLIAVLFAARFLRRS